MADIPIKKSRGKKYIGGASPIVPSYVVGDAPPPNNPPGSGGIDDFVTLDTDQTITGEKTFDNEFLSLVGYNPILTIKATSNQSTLNFKNFTNEDQGGIILDTPSSKLSIVTRTDNSDIEINPHGTGNIVLPNLPFGRSTSFLMLDPIDNNKVIFSTGTTRTDLISGFTITDLGGGATYSYTTGFVSIVNFSGQDRLEIILNGISTTGTPTGILEFGFTSTGIALYAEAGIKRLEGSNISNIEKRIPVLSGTSAVRLGLIDDYSSVASSVTFTAGNLSLYIYI